MQLEDPEPWADPVNGAALLDAIAATFTRYLALPAHASTALALWVLHTYTFQAWFTSPFLAITSPVKRCGKTLLLIVLGALVPRRLFASNVTPAVLFRTIEKYGPTLLIDEADTFIRDNDELRGVLNSGHTRTTAVVIRAVGDDHDPRAFSTWCPKAIALIGRLPDTLADRAIEIAMRRRTAGERVERLRQDRIEGECADLRRQAARWAADHLADAAGRRSRGAGRAARPGGGLLAPAAGDCGSCRRPLAAAAREAAKAISGVDDEGEQPAAILSSATCGASSAPTAGGVVGRPRESVTGAGFAAVGDVGQRRQGADVARAGPAPEGLRDPSRQDPVWRRHRQRLHPPHVRGRVGALHPSKPEQRNNSNNDGPETSFSQPEHPENLFQFRKRSFAQ